MLLNKLKNPAPLWKKGETEDILGVNKEKTVNHRVMLPDELWLHIFSYLNYESYCNTRLVCKRFYMIGKEPVLSPAPTWSKQSIYRRRCYQFRRALSKKYVSLDEIRALAWKGVPSQFRATVYQLLIGFLPCDTEKHQSILQERNLMYEEMKKTRLHRPQEEKHEDFQNLLNRDLPRVVPSSCLDFSRIISSVLLQLNFTRGVPYNSTGMSIHFPLFQASYIQRVLERRNIQSKENDDISKYLEMKLPPEDQEQLESQFFWVLLISFDSLKVQGCYSENNRCDQSFVLKLLSQVDSILQEHDPELTEYLLAQGVFSRMYLYSWLTSAFSHSFPVGLVLRFWDSMLSEGSANGISIELLVFICAAIVLHSSAELKQLSSDSIFDYINDKGTSLTLDQSEIILAKAYLLMNTH